MRRACLLLVVGLLAVAPRAEAGGTYVALGDSYVAGALIPDLVGAPALCGRSSRNYPRLTAAALGLTLRDVSCSGAAIGHMTAPQRFGDGSANPAQFDALTPDVELVTIGLSANDTGIISVPGACATDDDPAPTSTACRRAHRTGGEDVVLARIARDGPRMAAVIRGIRERAPRARVVVVGYPALTPANGTNCYPTVPLSSDDLVYADELLRANNAMLRTQAAEYVSLYEDAVGHDICAPEASRWLEGFAPEDAAFPIHPNARGEAGFARTLLAALRTPPAPSALPPTAPVTEAARLVLRQERPARRTGPPPRFAVTLAAPARASFSLQRRTGPATYAAPRRFGRTLRAGTTRVRVARRDLGRRRGTYRLTVRAAGLSAVVRFRMR